MFIQDIKWICNISCSLFVVKNSSNWGCQQRTLFMLLKKIEWTLANFSLFLQLTLPEKNIIVGVRKYENNFLKQYSFPFVCCEKCFKLTLPAKKIIHVISLKNKSHFSHTTLHIFQQRYINWIYLVYVISYMF